MCSGAKVSATDPRVTDDKRVMIYWEKCPVKSMLVDPIYCLIPFKYSYSYKDTTQLQVREKSGGNSPTQSSPWSQQTCGTISRRHRSASPAGLLPGDGGPPPPGIKQSTLQTWAKSLLPDPCSCREQSWRELCQ